jgi:hypothetical protein
MSARPGSRLTCGRCGQRGHNKRSCGREPLRRGKLSSVAAKAKALRQFYRLSLADYMAMLAEGCAVCGRGLDDRTPDVDHDHQCDHPGKGLSSCRACVRGLLCRSCNLRVGAFERGQNQDPDIARYLGRAGHLSSAMMQATLF